MPQSKEDKGLGAVAIAEEAFFLLRGSAGRTLPIYLIGTMPFVAGLIWYWADMALHPLARERAPLGALVLTLLFAWMRTWQAVFAQRMLAEAQGIDREPRRPWHVVRMVVRQTFAHAMALVLLPVALVSMLPFGWAYAFFHTYTILEDGTAPRMRDTTQEAWQLAQEWPRQNHTLIWLCSPFIFLALVTLFTTIVPIATAMTPGWTNALLSFYALILSLLFLPFAPIGLLIAVNIGSGILLIPFLLDTLLGVRTLLSDGLISPFNTTYLLIVCGLTYCCLDPLMKSAYVVRVFYGRARKSGEDLRRSLRQVVPAAALVLLVAGGSFNATAAAQPPETSVEPAALDQALDDELAGSAYLWGEVRQHPLDAEDSMVARAAQAIGRFVQRTFEVIGNGIRWVLDKVEGFLDWIFGSRDDVGSAEPASPGARGAPLRVTMVLLSAALLLLLAYLAYRAWRARQEEPDALRAHDVATTPDLRDESTLATDLPEDEWVRLARECMQRGDLRLAARALFLATLALLADRQLIRIARHKSNRDYRRELARYQHERPALLERYAESMHDFESVWYGDHLCSQQTVTRLERNREELASHG